MDSDRIKIIWIRNEDICSMLLANNLATNSVTVPTFPDLPPDVAFDRHGIDFDFNRQAFGVIVSHPTFPVVPACSQIPEVQAGPIKIVWLERKIIDPQPMMPPDRTPEEAEAIRKQCMSAWDSSGSTAQVTRFDF